jgi:hypothetical protein
MTRGPIHEAFAQPVNTGSVKPLIVPKKPPDPIEEEPPSAKPADENAVWIAGYWGWDDDRKDFLWVSGVWRVPPPNQQWVPGYWTQVSGGFEWVPGFWTAAGAQEVAYQPEPPASLEQGPTSDPPGDDYFWAPGCWHWRQTRYVWQPGFWSMAQPGWLWMPPSYCWSPRGWVFCDGYWDYPLGRRGLVFAPVYFSAGVYRRPHFFFSPTVVIDAGRLPFCLFTRPSYCHYYFGDYYAASYDGLGIFPWFAVRSYRGYVCDPFFSYYECYNRRRDADWLANLRGWHQYYRTHADQRPPHTLAAQQQLLARAGNRPDREFLGLTETLNDLQRKPNAPIRLTSISSAQKVQIHQTARLMTQSGTQRAELEAKGAGAAGVTAKVPVTMPLPKLPAIGSAQGVLKGAGKSVTPGKPLPGKVLLDERLPKTPARILPDNSLPEHVLPERKIPKTPEKTLPRVSPERNIPEALVPQKTPPGHEGGTGSKGKG